MKHLLIHLFILTFISACGQSDSSTNNTADSHGGSENMNGNQMPPAKNENFVNFESGQVRPLALSADGGTLYATNTAASTLEILKVTDEDLQQQFSIPVGMEPVAVAVRSESEVWVVNHLSDSISVVDVSMSPPVVIKTLLVGDEPRDIVFAGERGALAFVTTAHRGQNGPADVPVDAELSTPGANRADVWVFDSENTGQSVGGNPLTVVSMFGDTPRALASNADGSVVYAAVMHSGNRTTAIGESRLVKSGPTTSSDGTPQPDTGLIVQFDGVDWRDETGATTDMAEISYNSLVSFSLPDYDVFALSTDRTPEVIDKIAGVGTTLFNMVVNPVNNSVYVSNTEVLNVNRFEGENHSGSSVRGNFARSRISIINQTTVVARDLNKHLDHSQSIASTPQRALSVAQPVGMAITADGTRLYVAAFGSKKIVMYETSALEDGSFAVELDSQIKLDAGGPAGVVIDETRNRLYTLTRFNNSIAVVNTSNLTQLRSLPLFNPEPAIITAGRKFLYDASEMSSHGDVSCATCHVFGDVDALAWDLGNPGLQVATNSNRFANQLEPDGPAVFHPLKGPMTTQSLRGLSSAGPMHWRGDRTGESATSGETLEHAAFRDFNIAFPELLGRDAPLSNTDINAFAEFALTLAYPPNPIRSLDNSLSVSQSNGRNTYMEKQTTGTIFTCNDCHTLDASNEHFGTSGLSSIEGDDISQEFKIPHLRNAYQKVGKFGNSGIFSPTTGQFGPQVKGFGFMHDGNMDTLDSFFKGEVFRFANDATENDRLRAEVVDFVMAFDSNMAPVVGQQITLNENTLEDTDSRIELLIARAKITEPVPECDLIAKGVTDNRMRGYLMLSDGRFQSDRKDEIISYSLLRARAMEQGGAITFSCVPPGSGPWMGIDRNLDDVFDGDE